MALAFTLWLAVPAAALAAWEPAAPISQDAAPAGVGNGGRTDLAVGANGLATAFFNKAEGNQPFLARRAAGGSGWSAPEGLAPGSGPTNWDANLAANSAGDVLGIWRFSGNFIPPQTASWPAGAQAPSSLGVVGSAPPAAFVNAPLVGIDDAGNRYAVTQTNREVFFYRFDAATQSWGDPTEVFDGSGAQLAVNGRGDVAVSYSQGGFPDPEIFVHRKLAGDTDFSEKRKFDFRGNGFDGHALALGPGGAITVVFTEDRSGSVFRPQVFARHWQPGQEEPYDDEKVELLSSPRPAYQPASAPRVVVDPEGRVTAAWLETNNGGLSYLYSAERTDDRGFGSRDRISESNQQFTDDESSRLPDNPPSGPERPVSSYDLTVDAEGTATVVYSDSEEGLGGFTSSADVKAARRATGGRWSAPVSLRSTAPGAGPVTVGRERVAAGRARQADATFVQQVDGSPQLMATRFEGPPPPSGEHQAMVTSRDKDGAETKILVQWCPAAGLDPGEEAPTIIAGSGWGIPGRRCPPGNSPEEEGSAVFGDVPVGAFTNAGYNVLTFDARGFWRSGGTVQVNSPGYEGRDMQALIDYVARQREALLDAPADPRLGMSGVSYGGGIQLVTAALDRRVDAIAPSIAWNSLVTSLFPRETVKAGWAAILYGAGVPTTTLPGVLSPAGIKPAQEHMAQEIHDAFAEGVRGGTIAPDTRKWFADRGPDFLLSRIKAPTLLIQGTVDTLFTLDEAHRNFEALRAAGTEVKMLWFCGGHGACERPGADQEHVDRRVLAWFDRHLRGRAVSTGPLFEWVDERGRFHASEVYPPPLARNLRGSGSGDLSLTPGELPGSGGLIFATPFVASAATPAGVEVPIEVPVAGSTVLGAPRLRLTYTAEGVSTYGTGVEGAAEQRTYVYAQIVDRSRQRVVGNVATPIPITLDSAGRELSLPLERIASRSGAAGYALQIVPQTSVYDGQRAAGVVRMSSIEVTLPVAGAAVGGALAGVEGAARRAASRGRVPRCGGLRATIVGTAGDDVLVGTPGRDVIVGLGGDDTIRGRGGNDVICGGAGNDRISGGRGNDRIWGGRGNDRISGGRGNDRIWGGRGNDRIRGGRGRDTLRGGPGHDTLSGGPGHDRLSGGPGHDRLSGGPGHDRLSGGPGNDRLRGGRGNDRLFGGRGNDILNGGPGRNILRGGKGRNRILGKRS